MKVSVLLILLADLLLMVVPEVALAQYGDFDVTNPLNHQRGGIYSSQRYDDDDDDDGRSAREVGSHLAKIPIYKKIELGNERFVVVFGKSVFFYSIETSKKDGKTVKTSLQSDLSLEVGTSWRELNAKRIADGKYIIWTDLGIHEVIQKKPSDSPKLTSVFSYPKENGEVTYQVKVNDSGYWGVLTNHHFYVGSGSDGWDQMITFGDNLEKRAGAFAIDSKGRWVCAGRYSVFTGQDSEYATQEHDFKYVINPGVKVSIDGDKWTAKGKTLSIGGGFNESGSFPEE